MKLVKYFDEFLQNHVNLNQSRIDKLERRVGTIEKLLRNNEIFGKYIQKMVRQGSWAHKTIIKPLPKSNEFDADVLLYFTEFDNWEPKDYVENLYSEFRKNDIYKNKVARKTRCVTLDYSDEFHIDIVPAFIRESFFEERSQYITNRVDNSEEETNPDGYTNWFAIKNKTTTKNNLVKVVRLAKYMRDIKSNFSAKSILLTTMLGLQVYNGYFVQDDVNISFTDIPTSLKTIFNRLNNFLKNNYLMPQIENPSLPGETFTRHWDEAKYQNFREKIKVYTEKINDAYYEKNTVESAKKWQQVFGDQFATWLIKVAETDEFGYFNKFSVTSHCKPPMWLIRITGRAQIDAYVYGQHNLTKLSGINSDGRKLPKGLSLHFYAKTNILKPFKIFWQVVNTGFEAENANDLRGEFLEDGFQHNESTKYEGKHWIEYFIIKNGVCVARSGRFIVNIS